MQYRCIVLPVELSGQRGAGHYVGPYKPVDVEIDDYGFRVQIWIAYVD